MSAPASGSGGTSSCPLGRDPIANLEVSMNEQLTLTRLGPDMRSAYLDILDECMEAGEDYPYNNNPLAREDFAAYVRELQEEEQGIGLPPGVVPQTTYILVESASSRAKASSAVSSCGPPASVGPPARPRTPPAADAVRRWRARPAAGRASPRRTGAAEARRSPQSHPRHGR